MTRLNIICYGSTPKTYHTPVFTPKCTGNFDNCYELNAKTSSKAPWSYDNNLLCMCPFVTYLDSQAYCLCKVTRETDKAVFRRIRSYTSRSNSIHFHRKPLELHLWSIWSFIFLYSQREQLNEPPYSAEYLILRAHPKNHEEGREWNGLGKKEWAELSY